MSIFRKNDMVAERLFKKNRRVRAQCLEKESLFLEVINEGVRHGSKLADRYMANRKEYIIEND